MATTGASPLACSSPMELHPHWSLDSFSAAIVLLPPPSIQTRLNLFRSANDKSSSRWTAHITLVFPFVNPEHISTVLPSLKSAIDAAKLNPFPICLDKVDRFRQRDYDTVYLGQTSGPNGSVGNEEVHRLWAVLAETLGYKGRTFVPHLTLGQCSHNSRDAELFQSKCQRVLHGGPVYWTVSSVVVLRKDDKDSGRMKVTDEIFLHSLGPAKQSIIASEAPYTYHYNPRDKNWHPALVNPAPQYSTEELSVLTFNILHSQQFPSISRFQDIRNVLLESNTDILCLQEVTDELLTLLLRDELICSRWMWSTRSPDTPMESERNVLVMTKDTLPFSWSRFAPSGQHKAMSLLNLHFVYRDSPIRLVFSAVHLTAGLTPQLLEAKTNEMLSLVRHLKQNHTDAEWIVAGDTNLPSNHALPSVIQDSLMDVWNYRSDPIATTHKDATYDPERNTLAAQTARSCMRPQRYDRVFVKRSGLIHARSIVVLSSIPSVNEISDHWPLHAVLHIGSPEDMAEESVSDSSASAGLTEADIIPWFPLITDKGNGVEDPDSNLCAFALAEKTIPNVEQINELNRVLQTLCRVLGTLRRGRSSREGQQSDTRSRSSATSVHLVLVPVGSVSMGLNFPESDLDCIVVGNVNPSIFWAITRQRIVGQSPVTPMNDRVFLRRFVKDAAVQMMILEVNAIKIDLQYCPATNIAENWSSLSPSLDMRDVTLPVSSMRVLNAYRDRLCLQKYISSTPAFHLAFRYIKLFCIRHGIFGARFGYLGGIHLTILCCSIAKARPDIKTASEFVREFFRVYAHFDWASDLASISETATAYRRTSREPMAILSAVRPVVNHAVNATFFTLQAIVKEFRLAHKLLSEGCSWDHICGEETMLAAFLDDFDRFIRIDVSYWGGNCMAARALLGYVESRIVHLLVDLRSVDHNATVRLWPERLTDIPANATTKTSSVQGFYLLGLHCDQNSTSARPLTSALQACERLVCGNMSYYNAATSFFSISESQRTNLGAHIIVDKPAWSDDGIDDASASDSEDEGEGRDDSRYSQSNVDSRNTFAKNHQKARSKVNTHVPAEKLRTSSDIYNRLMWDPQLDQNDYLIGYEDRFVGIKEVPLKDWKRDINDEAFIPFHRVVFFRCRSTDELVWDRRTKLDLIFRSGKSTKT